MKVFVYAYYSDEILEWSFNELLQYLNSEDAIGTMYFYKTKEEAEKQRVEMKL